MKNYKIIFCSILLYFTITTINAQSVITTASIDSSTMMIGEQRTITLEVTQTNDVVTNFPLLSQTDTLVPGIELISISPYDTIKTDDGYIKVKQEYIITSFDTGSYVIPEFKFSANSKTYETKSINLNVVTYNEDLTNAKVRDIKPNFEPPFNWFRLLLYFSFIVILAAGIYLAYYIYQITASKPVVIKQIKIVDNRLPHEIAIEELDSIKEKKSWKNGLVKLYYTEVSDTLREYFMKRFKIPAMEMTSAEILDSLKYNNEAAPVIDKVSQIFTMSDMVKFAKYQPSPEINELSIVNAYFIVNQTTVIPVQTVSEEEKKEDEESTVKKEDIL